MIRRRVQPDITVPVETPSVYEKSGRANRGIPFFRTSLGVFATIFFLFPLLMLVHHLDKLYVHNTHYEPNNKNVTITKNGGSKKPLKKRPPSTKGATVSKLPSVTPDKNSIGAIPYIRYNSSTIKNIKEGMDYAFSHGDTENPNNANNTRGQYLLDFGIIGFPKCGTTTMMKWLNMHDQIAVITKEIMALQKIHPVGIIRHVANYLPEGQYRRGYKSPSDVEDGRAMNKLGIHYPKTKLLVGLRHPVLWFESFYNHRIQNGNTMPNLVEELSKPNAEKTMKNFCGGNWNGACFPRANFHSSLVKWGKTPLLSVGNSNKDYNSYFDAGYDREAEWKLFSKKEKRKLQNDVNNTKISPNPIFLYDVSQLHIPPSTSDAGDEEKGNQKHYDDFVLSLQEFLGVPKNVSVMPPMIKESPGRTQGINATEQKRLQSLKIDLCDEELALARKWLIEIGADVAEWITNYFSKSPHGVYFGGGTAHFLKILESYGKDPCPERILRKQGK